MYLSLLPHFGGSPAREVEVVVPLSLPPDLVEPLVVGHAQPLNPAQQHQQSEFSHRLHHAKVESALVAEMKPASNSPACA